MLHKSALDRIPPDGPGGFFSHELEGMNVKINISSLHHLHFCKFFGAGGVSFWWDRIFFKGLFVASEGRFWPSSPLCLMLSPCAVGLLRRQICNKCRGQLEALEAYIYNMVRSTVSLLSMQKDAAKIGPASRTDALSNQP